MRRTMPDPNDAAVRVEGRTFSYGADRVLRLELLTSFSCRLGHVALARDHRDPQSRPATRVHGQGAAGNRIQGGQRAPVSSSPTADRGADPLRLGPATLVSAGLPRGRPGARSPVAASSRLTMRTRASTTNPGALSGALDGSNTWPTWRPAVLAVPLAATSPRSAAARSLAGTPDGRS